MNRQFRYHSIEEFLDALSSTSPTPGGGAAAGLLAAQACALAEKTCRLTVTNKAYASVKDDAEKWASLLSDARAIMLDLMDEDAANFKALMDMYRRPAPSDEGGKLARKEMLQRALQKAAEAPMQIAQTMADLLTLFTQVLEKGNQNLLTDSIIALQCAMAAIRASILNVRINMKYVDNEFFVREMEDTIRSWQDKMSAADAVLTYQVTL